MLMDRLLAAGLRYGTIMRSSEKKTEHFGVQASICFDFAWISGPDFESVSGTFKKQGSAEVHIPIVLGSFLVIPVILGSLFSSRMLWGNA